MKNTSVTLVLLISATISVLVQSFNTAVTDPESIEIEKLMQYCYENEMFNGAILVTKNCEPIYKNAFGFADKNNNRMLNESSVFHLASVSKQFTAMAVMILKEQNKLSYDDKLSSYFPEFPDYADSVTIKHLMTHTSGIADQYSLGIDKMGLTNSDVKEFLIKQKQLDFTPGDRFSYSNGGYVLLALIVEKVSDMPFHKFMEANIFKPLKMSNTLVYNESTPEIDNRAKGYNDEGDPDDYVMFTSGDGGILSTINDLHTWDKALYSEKLVSKSTLEEAFTRATINNGDSIDYGYGWEIADNHGQKVVQHSGGAFGYINFIKRNLSTKGGYIFLTNHGNTLNFTSTIEALDNILNGKPYTFPKIPISSQMSKMLKSYDVDFVIKDIRKKLDSETDKYEANELGINALGYRHLKKKNFDTALAIFKINVDYNSSSANVYDSFGEALLASGDTLQAIKNYKKSLELDGYNTNAIRILKNLDIKTDNE